MMKHIKRFKILLPLMIVCMLVIGATPVSAGYKVVAENAGNLLTNVRTQNLSTDKTLYQKGEQIYVTAAPVSEKAWVGVTKSGKTISGEVGHASYFWDWVNTDGSRFPILEAANLIGSGDLGELSLEEQGMIDTSSASLNAGTYDLVLFADVNGDEYNEAARVTITVDDEFSIQYMDGDKAIDSLAGTYKYTDAKNGSIALKSAPEKTGHTFAGWYDNADLTGNAVTVIPQGSTGDKTYYAKYDKIKYDVTFNTDGGSAVEKQSVPYGDKAAKPAENPTKDGVFFLGWVTAANGSTPFDFNQPITGATTIYAKWGDVNGHAVEFDTQGGSQVLSAIVPYDGKVSKPADPTKNGYTFDKWVKADGSAYDFDTPVTGAMTLKAVWKPVTYTITFNANGGSAVANKTYNIETADFTLPTTTKAGYSFVAWKDAAGRSYTKISKGTTGNLSLTAEWKKATTVVTDKDVYVQGDAIKVTSYCDLANPWVGLYRAGDTPGTSGVVSYNWEAVGGYSGEEFNILKCNFQKSVGPGEYVVYLFEDMNNYTVLASKKITIKENPNPAKGELIISGYSRDDKTYAGNSKADRGVTLYEYFYGDALTVKGSVSGYGVEGAWIGVISDDSYSSGRTDVFSDNWIYLSDFPNQEVNLNYVVKSVVTETATAIPFGLNYWVVLVTDGGQILDAKAFNYRTYNMDWFGAVWEDVATKNLIYVTDWSSRMANGTEQKPTVTIKRVNGHFGLVRDASGKLTEITEETLVEGKDYTISYPASSKDPGSYKIDVKFPSAGSQYNYLSTSSATYGLQEGIPYYLTSSANDHAIKYVLGGGINNEDNPELYQTGKAFKLLAPARSGFIFDGWYTTADFQAGTLIEVIPADASSDYTLYAKWISEDEATYKIKYVLNGGDNDPNNPHGYMGTVDITPRAAKKAGYNFEGWFYDAEFTKPADTIAKGTNADVTLYAKFAKADSNVVFVQTSVKGGSITNDRRAQKGDTVTITYKPNKGYVLKSVKVDGVAVDIKQFAESYTFENLDGDHKIDVVFKVKLAKATLSGIKTGNGKIQISWKAVNRAKEYRVYRSTNNKKYTLIGSTTELKYIDADVKAGQKYYYKVAAFANGSLGAKSAAKNIKAGKALKRAQLTSVIAKNGKVTAKWKKVNGAASYKLYRSANGGKTYTLVTTTKKTSFTTKKIQNAKWYSYKVVTVKNGIEGKMSAVKKVNVLDKTKNIKVSSKKKTVTVSWDKTKNAGKYEIYRSVDGGKTFKKVLTTKKTTATFKNLKAGKRHQYKVRAIYGKSYGKFTAVKKITVKK